MVFAASLLFATTPVFAQETSALERADPALAPVGKEASPAREYPALKRAIDTVLAVPEIGTSRVGIHAVDVATGEVIYSKNGDVRLNPASNIKLITGAAALDILGPQFTFTTTLLAEKLDGETVKGPLYVRGDGEAFLLFQDVLGWAGELHQKGVRRIDGDIVIDDSIFDGAYLPPGFEQKDADAAYRPPIGAVSVNFNAITAVVRPGLKQGDPPIVRLEPPAAHIELVNNATTGRGTRSRVDATSRPSGDRTVVTIVGTIGERSEAVAIRKRIDNPPLFAGSVFAGALEMVGIEFTGAIRTGSTPDGAIALVTHRSQPLTNIVAAMNKWSNNFMAEQLLRVLGIDEGQASTWDVSRRRAIDFMLRAGFEEGAFRLHNGSGLYDGNEISARQITGLLRYMRNHRFGPEFVSSLAIAGVDGTLRTRMALEPTAGNVRGKTGTLNHVAALSGYVHTTSGRLVAFSIIFNDTPTMAWNLRRHQDAITTAIANFNE
ncbi:MAG: D-alanyl-D-alanine carboxypeptidase/D-alanyl-D-alanine-endopeptidase [Bradymonadaceae bacterium]